MARAALDLSCWARIAIERWLFAKFLGQGLLLANIGLFLQAIAWRHPGDRQGRQAVTADLLMAFRFAPNRRDRAVPAGPGRWRRALDERRPDGSGDGDLHGPGRGRGRDNPSRSGAE